MSQASIVSPVGEDVAFFARGPSRKEIAQFRLSDAARDRLRELLDHNFADMLTPGEIRELDQMVLLDDIVSLIRAQAQTVQLPDTTVNGDTGA